MDGLEQFPWAGVASVLGALGYLVGQTANYKSKIQPKPEISLKDLDLLLDAREGKIMRQFHQILIDKGL